MLTAVTELRQPCLLPARAVSASEAQTEPHEPLTSRATPWCIVRGPAQGLRARLLWFSSYLEDTPSGGAPPIQEADGSGLWRLEP